MAIQEITTQPVKWPRISSLAVGFALIGVIVNETLLRSMEHRPTVVSDHRLWAMVYDGFLNDHNEGAIAMLGASRMQGDISLATVREVTGADSVYQLALSGHNSCHAVFRDIVDNTDFRGLILISETERSLAHDKGEQNQVVREFEARPLDANFNRHLSNLLQSQFVFLNPNSDSYRLWGNLLLQRQAPEVYHVSTLINREQALDFSRTNVDRINRQRAQFFGDGKKDTSPVDPEKWMAKVSVRWEKLVKTYQARGGKVVFVRFPVSAERSVKDRQRWPTDQYWSEVMQRMGVPAVHYQEHPELADFEFPDSSHLDMRDKNEFTRRLFNNSVIYEQLPSHEHE